MEFGPDDLLEQLAHELAWVECLLTLRTQAAFGSIGAARAVVLMLEDRGRWLRN